jgi:TonB-linked SusC/RagA family outer membrane protein
LLIFLLQVTQKSAAQTITLSGKNIPLKTVFTEIKKQCGFKVIYNKNILSDVKPVTVDVERKPLLQFLNEILPPQQLEYEMQNKTIIVKPKVAAGLNPQVQNESHPAITVHGRIVDEAGQAVIASIIIIGTKRGTTSNVNGEFELNNVRDDAVLEITATNIESATVKVKGKANLLVAVKLIASALEEVVVNAGYYNVKQKEATGSIGKVDAKTIEKQPVTNPLAAISGRISGVSVQQTTGIPGGEFKIEIRGRNSLRYNGNEPLYIVDGVPFSMEKISDNSTTADLIKNGVSPLSSINSADIESIEILKDADALSIYGSRGANGVVLITTKKGKAGKTKVDISYYYGWGKVKLQKLLNTEEYLAVRNEAFNNDHIVPTNNPDDDKGLEGKGYAADLKVWDTTQYTDWQKVFLGKTAHTNSIQTSISGGTLATQFLISAGYYNETSVFPGSFHFSKSSFHSSINHTSENKKLFINFSANGTLDKHEQPQTDFSLNTLLLAPDAPNLYNPDGSPNWAYHPITGKATWENPIAQLVCSYEGHINNLSANTVIGYNIFPAIRIQSRVGYNSLSSEELRLMPSTQFDPSLGKTAKESAVNAANAQTQTWIIEPQINWDRKIFKGKLSILIGSTYQKEDHKLRAIGYFDFPSNALLRDLSAARISQFYGYVSSIYKYSALFSRINYNWEEKYIINLTARRDGSSRFGSDRQYANFGALGAAWIFSQESFAGNLSWLSFGKLRGSYGITGSDQIGNYQFLDTYQTPNNINAYDGTLVLDPTRLYNAVFGWESNRKLEGALELGFLQNKLSLSIAYYANCSSNQLINYTLPATTGFNGIQANLDATVQNTGLEVEFSSTNIKVKNFSWVTSFNLTIPQNKLIRFPNLDSSTYSNTYIIGQSLYIQKFFNYTGVNTQTGLYTVKDYNNDGLITTEADMYKGIFIGQNFFGGLSNTVTYKKLALNIFVQFVKQTGILQTLPYGVMNRNFPKYVLTQTRWLKEGDLADVQKYSTEYAQGGGINGSSYGNSHYNYYYSDAAVTNASFLRLKTISLTYGFQSNESGIINNCQVFVRGQNLAVLSKYRGRDPETSLRENLSPLRTITVGITLTL